MIDTHAHLDFPDFDKDREDVIRRAFDNGVKKIVNVGVDLKTSKKSIDLAENYENIFATVGYHPHDAGDALEAASEDDFSKLKKLASHRKVVAIGEVGLDYSRTRGASQIERQKKLLTKQLDIANDLKLPVVVHCRDAWDDLYEIIANYNLKNTKFVLHCFSGDKNITEKFLDLPRVFFSFSGNITYPKPMERAENYSEVIKLIPLDRLMLDSDSPYLAPQAERGKRNEPLYIRYIAEKIAEIKEISVQEVEIVTDKNAMKFFGLGQKEKAENRTKQAD